MKTNIARWLSWIVGAWTATWGLLFLAPVSAASSSPESATSGAHPVLKLAISAPPCDRPGGGDHRFVLDNPDDLDAEATASIGSRDTQSLAPLSEVQPDPLAIFATHTGPRHSASIVEPRFLRYRRLLN